jgi:hypothetical protein
MSCPYAKYAVLTVSVTVTACSTDVPPPQESQAQDSSVTEVADTRLVGRRYERNLVFVGDAPETRVIVPWFFGSRTAPGTVERDIRAWLIREGSWDPFFDDRWETAPTRAPWRILPRGGLRLVMGQNDALEEILFYDGPRRLELACAASLADWSGPRGEQVRVIEASVSFSGVPVEGTLLDFNRTWRPDQAIPGDWAYLTSGDSVQLVLQDPDANNAAATYRAWARAGSEDSQWPEVRMDWSEVRAYEPARRDVPSVWTLDSGDGELEGSFAVVSSRIEAGTGAGPLLPVDALLEVEGTIRLFGREFPVQGLVRHVQQ